MLFTIAYYSAWREGVLSRVTFKRQNFWHENLNKYDIITIFGVESIIPDVLSKVERECKLDTYIMSFRFPVKSKVPIWSENELFMYIHKN